MKKQENPDVAPIARAANNHRVSERLQEIYEGRYGYRQTASGKWRERDEPDTETQYKQSDFINKILDKKRQEASKERLKAAGKVPVRAKTGAKLFEDFCKETYKNRPKDIDNPDYRNIYNAATQLPYSEWLLFIVDEYGSRI